MKLDATFANEVKKAGNGDGSREYVQGELFVMEEVI